MISNRQVALVFAMGVLAGASLAAAVVYRLLS